MQVNKTSETSTACTLVQRPIQELGDGEVTVAVSHSSLNYKDALACTAHPGVAKSLPLVPGIDAAGTVVDSSNAMFSPGDSVMIFHAKFGTELDGGYSQYARVPADWVYKIPAPLDAETTMTLGTAGFTAAQCVDQLVRHGVRPDSGPVVVSGATGGVGVFSVILLGKLGYEVIASTGKTDRTDWLLAHGATKVIDRSELDDDSGRPLLKAQFAGAVDTVGSTTLSTILRSTQIGGCVTACGLAGGFDLPISVYPFILRGISLQGVDTANIPISYRKLLWDRLASEWYIDGLEKLNKIISFEGLAEHVEQILAGQVAGRVVLAVS